MANPFAGVTLTPADLPQPLLASAASNGGGAGGGLEFYGPGHSGAVAHPNPNSHAEVSPVFGGDGPG